MIWLFAATCARIDPHVTPYGGWPLWFEVDEDGDIDLGHRPREREVDDPGPLSFVDDTAARGLGSALAGGNDHGVGIALVDLDGDGAIDLVLASGRSNVTGEITPSALYWNQGDGTFVDGTDALGGALVGADLYSVAAADVDNDGDVDLYFGGQPRNVLLSNDGGRAFTDVSAATGADGPASDSAAAQRGSSKIVAIGDIDRDGWLDLVSATSTLPDPGVTVLHNDGGTFTDVTEGSGAEIHPDGNPCAVMFTDYDNDGWRDLWIWNDGGGHQLLHNVGGTFDALRNRADLVNIVNPMGIDGADIDHDGDLDYFVSNIGDHPLLVNQGDGTFEDESEARGTVAEYGWGLGFEDLDLDGWVDLYLAQEDGRDTFVFRNDRGEAFTRTAFDVRHPSDFGAAHNTPVALGDVDRDGLVDAAWARTDGSGVGLHHNTTDAGGGHWLEVRIDRRPSTGERGGVDARVVVVTGDTVQFRDVTAGASRGSQSALSARFGLGGWDGADRVVVAWPDGETVSYARVPGDQTLVVAP